MNKYRLPQWVKDFSDHLKRTASQMEPAYAKIEAKILKRLEDDVASAYQMKPAYAEIEAKLTSCDDRKRLLDAIVKSAVIIESGRKQELKRKRKHLKNLQDNISSTVGKLIRLLDEHEEYFLSERRGIFYGRPYQDPIELVMQAGINMKPVARRSHFKTRVSPVLGGIYYDYDGEKMPKLQEVLQILKKRMNENLYDDSSALLLSRKSVANKGKINGSDFIRFLAREMNILGYYGVGFFPYGFCLTAKTIANITRCVLELDDYDEVAVKKVFKNM